MSGYSQSLGRSCTQVSLQLLPTFCVSLVLLAGTQPYGGGGTLSIAGAVLSRSGA